MNNNNNNQNVIDQQAAANNQPVDPALNVADQQQAVNNQQMNVNQNVIGQQQAMNNQQVNMNQNIQQNGLLTNPYVNNNLNQATQGLNANPYINQADVNNANEAGMNGGDFIKGALIGAGVAFLLTNKTTQSAIFNGFSKGSDLVQAGIEELKERMEDAKAQMGSKQF